MMRCRVISAGGWAAVLVSWTLLGAGCGRGPKEFRFAVHPASGTVTFKGKPLGGAIVRFHPGDPSKVTVPEGEEGPPVLLTTETNPDGTFSMSTYLADDGIPAGDYTVTVAVGLGGGGGDEEEVSVEDGDGPAVPAPAPKRSGPDKRYRDAATSPLKASVKADQANTFTFELD